jgi:hypothetical protein
MLVSADLSTSPSLFFDAMWNGKTVEVMYVPTDTLPKATSVRVIA